jgi:hypothetical protein
LGVGCIGERALKCEKCSDKTSVSGVQKEVSNVGLRPGDYQKLKGKKV